ncbi:hypothetical protein FBU30_003020 [Linnemannia zychae]|nr:hypothetical protein FBU30_003020 [Linnemannia zychae]
MQNKGWTVKVADTEADLAIAINADPDAIIFSSDSNMMAYATAHTLWRPVSGSVILVYNIPDLLGALDITRAQLTALAVDIVLAYLSYIQAVCKNTSSKDFSNSIRVFVDLQQTKVEMDESQPGSQILFEQLQGQFREICKRYNEHKQHQPRGAQLR